MDNIRHATTGQFISFILGNERYGINVILIKEVLEVPHIIKVPKMPDFIRGVINLRGSVIPVIDLGMKFGTGKTESTVNTRIVVVEVEDVYEETNDQKKITIGVLTDSVEKVLTLLDTDIEPPPKMATTIDISFIYGIGKIDEEFILLLNIEYVLNPKELQKVCESEKSVQPESNIKYNDEY